MTAPSRTGGQILVDQLLIHGVDHIFCVPGESYLAALDALHDASIEVTVCRQEGGAAMMAEAYGKLTGRPGICFVTRGPGATNASPGIHIAKQDSTPMILFVGQIERGMREREAFQELDYRAAFGPLAKWATEVDDPARFPEIVSRAFHVATSGRPGPVVIALPEDVLTEMAAVADAPRYQIVETHPGLTQMAELQKLLHDAKNPVALLGGSRWSEVAVQRFERFAERFELPVACTFRRQMLFPADHASYIGDLGLGVNPKLLARIKDADLVLLVGGRLSEIPSQAYTLLDIPAPQQTLVHVHPDPSEIGRVYAPHLAINASPIAFTAALGGRASAGLAALERGHEDGACGLSGLERSDRRPSRRRAADGRGDGLSSQDAAVRHDLLQRRRQLRHLGPPLLAVPRLRHATWLRPPAPWATACRQASAPSASSPTAPWWCSPATATSS